jgi:hypothetical protein
MVSVFQIEKLLSGKEKMPKIEFINFPLRRTQHQFISILGKTKYKSIFLSI